MTAVAGVKVIVENKLGAEGAIAMAAVKAAPPDGYTMVVTSSSQWIINPVLISSLAYDPIADFIPLSSISRVSVHLFAGPSVPFKTVKEFIAAARANPGKYTFATGTSATRLGAEMFAAASSIKVLNVPYKANPNAALALAGGEVDMMVADAAGMGTFYKSGRVRPLLWGSSKRSADFPNVPTFQEEGLVDAEVAGWYAAAFPAGTPPVIVETMRDILRRATRSKALLDTLHGLYMEPLHLAGDEVNGLIRSDMDKMTKAVRAAGLRPQ
ncbi:tripartite tricarboxylate transporter substrate binding protein [Variovorax paradoxus]|nr:tripartite tricarboxylate transporter substrate binding protein [Variovorax paradoxus]